jgi:hypothetical protein
MNGRSKNDEPGNAKYRMTGPRRQPPLPSGLASRRYNAAIALLRALRNRQANWTIVA